MADYNVKRASAKEWPQLRKVVLILYKIRLSFFSLNYDIPERTNIRNLFTRSYQTHVVSVCCPSGTENTYVGCWHLQLPFVSIVHNLNYNLNIATTTIIKINARTIQIYLVTVIPRRTKSTELSQQIWKKSYDVMVLGRG